MSNNLQPTRTITNEIPKTDTRFQCPDCGSHYHGSNIDTATNEITAYPCHDQYGKGCRKCGPYEEMFVTVRNVIVDNAEDAKIAEAYAKMKSETDPFEIIRLAVLADPDYAMVLHIALTMGKQGDLPTAATAMLSQEFLEHAFGIDIEDHPFWAILNEGLGLVTEEAAISIVDHEHDSGTGIAEQSLTNLRETLGKVTATSFVPRTWKDIEDVAGIPIPAWVGIIDDEDD